MIKVGTWKSDILELIKVIGPASCAQICDAFNLKGLATRSDSISSILSQMVRENILEVDKEKKGPRGGTVYRFGQKPQIKKLILKLNLNAATSNN